MGSLIFSKIKLEFKFETFKTPEVGKDRNIRNNSEPQRIISLHQVVSGQGTGSGADIHE